MRDDIATDCKQEKWFTVLEGSITQAIHATKHFCCTESTLTKYQVGLEKQWLTR